MDIKDIQKRLKEYGVDGWLLYDFCRTNSLACEVLGVEGYVTRRFFYWIPVSGEPVQIVHKIEEGVLAHLPGKKRVYFQWQTLGEALRETLRDVKKVAMEYSPNNTIPEISKVDGGTIDLVRSCGAEVVSSGAFLQYYTCVWSPKQLALHLEAAKVLDQTAAKTWKWIARQLGKVTEYDVQQFILEEIHRNGCVMEGLAICGVNANSANPHYCPQKERALKVREGDFILIDLWCKKDVPEGVYADITRVAVASRAPTARQKEVFQIVRKAQRTATEFVREGVRGCEVDAVCRKVVEAAGYGAFFVHRTGHNIDKTDHGPGANIDGLETYDERPLVAGTCFSIEPGIYLPGEFGVRLEYDVFLHPGGKVEVTGGIQEEVVSLLEKSWAST